MKSKFEQLTQSFLTENTDHSKILNANNIINDYLEAVAKRAEQSGDGRLDYAMGYIYSTLRALKLQSYDLEILQRDTENLDRKTRFPHHL